MPNKSPENTELVWHIQKRLNELGYDVSVDGDLGPRTYWDQSETLTAILDHLGGPVNLPDPAPARPSASGKKIFIDVGHGQKPDGFDPGAVNAGSGITEHQLNLIAARACATVLATAGATVSVDDSNRHNYSAGKAAKGSDICISIHHNSAGASAQGSEALYHAHKGNAQDKALAKLAAKAMAEELGVRNRGGKPMGLSVLSGARDVGVPVAIPHRAGEALARAVLEHLDG
ncbi:N-acetylmuramoyl-L-alanine amidase [Citromicrobium bathyomarinum]